MPGTGLAAAISPQNSFVSPDSPRRVAREAVRAADAGGFGSPVAQPACSGATPATAMDGALGASGAAPFAAAAGSATGHLSLWSTPSPGQLSPPVSLFVAGGALGGSGAGPAPAAAGTTSRHAALLAALDGPTGAPPALRQLTRKRAPPALRQPTRKRDRLMVLAGAAELEELEEGERLMALAQAPEAADAGALTGGARPPLHDCCRVVHSRSVPLDGPERPSVLAQACSSLTRKCSRGGRRFTARCTPYGMSAHYLCFSLGNVSLPIGMHRRCTWLGRQIYAKSSSHGMCMPVRVGKPAHHHYSQRKRTGVVQAVGLERVHGVRLGIRLPLGSDA